MSVCPSTCRTVPRRCRVLQTSGYTPLLVAVEYGRVGAVKALLAGGADRNVHNKVRFPRVMRPLLSGYHAPLVASLSCSGVLCVTLWSTCVVVCHCVAVVARRMETQLTHTAAEQADWYGHREILRLLEEKMDTSAGTATPSTAPTDGLAQLAIGSHTAGEGSFHDNSSTAAATASAAAATAAAAAASTAAAAVSAPGSTTQVAAATAPQSAGASAASTPVAPAVPPSSVSTYL